MNDWAVSGITQFQSGFPIRLDTENDNELIASIFFLGTEAPQQVAPFQKLNPKTNGELLVQPQRLSGSGHWAISMSAPSAASAAVPGLIDWDFAVHKKIAVTEDKYFQFRAEIFNIFNHTNFYNPDGHFSDGPTLFGKITQAQDPRLVQFALKFYF